MESAAWYRAKALWPSLAEAEKAAIRDDWREITGKEFSASFNPRCQNCYHDAAILILRAMNKQDNGGYELLPGIAFKFKGKVITQHNITPEAAEYWIRQDLKNRDFFINLAKDYDSYAVGSGKAKEPEYVGSK